MCSDREFHLLSYQRHTSHYGVYSMGGEQESLAQTWLRNDTVDAWRHNRMYRLLDPILETEPNARWLTVGDGRYGNDSNYISNKGCPVLASDISDVLLKEAKNIGYITEYRQENAELLSFADGEFDYVFCKESYHHFPRPLIALYEMMRVAAKGVVLIEPNDLCTSDKASQVLFRNMLGMLKRGLGREVIRHGFEEAGNYIYSISRREIEKVALGMNYNVIAFCGVNDFYLAGVEYEKLSERGPLYRKVKARIDLYNLLTRLGLRDYILLGAIIFKKDPSEILSRNLDRAGYGVMTLPKNPHISG